MNRRERDRRRDELSSLPSKSSPGPSFSSFFSGNREAAISPDQKASSEQAKRTVSLDLLRILF
jgi:hypothetical protein